MCKSIDGSYVPATEVIGYPTAKFVVVIPKVVVYSKYTAWHKEGDINMMATQSYVSSSQLPLEFNDQHTSAAQWHKLLTSLKRDKKVKLKTRLMAAQSCHAKDIWVYTSYVGVV